MSAAAPKLDLSQPAGRGLWSDALRRLRRNRAAMTSLLLLGLLVVAVTLGPLLSPNAFDSSDWDAILLAPTLAGGHWFGTDFSAAICWSARCTAAASRSWSACRRRWSAC